MDSSEPEINVPGRSTALPHGVKDAHILIVDDMALMRKMIGMCLERSGFENVTYAEDGDEALAQIAESMPDIVILDLNMPKMSGSELLKKLSAMQMNLPAKVFVLTTSDSDQDIINAHKYDISGYLLKSDLLESLRETLETLDEKWMLVK